jgi:hypothetical protein
MPRAKTKNTIESQIAAQERLLLSGTTEAVLVADADLLVISDLITAMELTKVQILKKAVHLGLQVLSINSKPAPVVADYLPTAEPEVVLFDSPNLEVPNTYTSSTDQGGWQFRGAAQSTEDTEC